MAEIAGAVSSLLGAIRDEAELLGAVRGDVQFIKEEMESMNSFLMHLARKTPGNGEHDEQVRTWMKQVRDLAHDCSSSIDIYLQRRDPAVYRARGILLGYVWWVPWFVKKTLAQHRAATQLRNLKARVRDVGERRLRYGVEVPVDSSDKLMAAAGVVAEEDHDFEEDYYGATSYDPRRELAFSSPRIFLKCTQRLIYWLQNQHKDGPFQAIAIVAPHEEDGRKIPKEALRHISVDEKFDNIFYIWHSPLDLHEPWDFLGDILKQLLRDDKIGKIKKKIDDKIRYTNGKIYDKIGKIKEQLGNKGYQLQVEPLGALRDILRVLLHEDATTSGEDQNETPEMILTETAEKAKKYLESAGENGSCRIGVELPQFEAILRELLPNTDKHANAAVIKPREDYVTKIIKDITLKIPSELLPASLHPQDKLVKESGQDHPSNQSEDCRERIGKVLERIKEHILIQETAGRVREHLQDTRTVVVVHDASGYKWDKTAKALQELGCSSMAVVVTTKYMEGVNKYCYGTEPPIVYSSIKYYHDAALHLTNQGVRVNGDNKYSATIFLEILEKCKMDQFCIKMFIHALFSNPTRSREQLDKLSNSLVFGETGGTNGYKMIKFSYNDLPRDYKTCLLYLAIFHKDEKINRTRLIGRWVADLLVLSSQDWASSVSEAGRCFEVLADLWLVCPCDLGAAGEVKSITLHPLVRNFITKMAKKEGILDTRLSGHLARHFSIHSNIRLRPSDTILDFLKQPSRVSSQLRLVKVLDLEGCASLRDNQRWLTNVCTFLILLKYLSLRNTDVTQLPKEINRLQLLEVLDIRQTPMNASATKQLMLRKLKRLLAGQTTWDGGEGSSNILSTVQMPHKVRKMTDLEVLSHVQAATHRPTELREIGQLWQLRVLGVVIYDCKAQLVNLLQGISDLNECLRSLSIEIKPSSEVAATHPAAFDISAYCRNTPQHLESLSLSGVTMHGRLLPRFAESCRKLARVTLDYTFLDQYDMQSLSDLPNLRGLRLRHVNLHTESKLIIQTNGFQNLKYLAVEGSGITDITFGPGKAPKLENIVWFINRVESLSGINNLPKLKEIVFSDGVWLPDQVKQAIEAHPNFIDNNGIWY